MNINPAAYWRNNKKWKDLLGKEGRVLFSTWISYSFVLVEIEGKKYEMMGVGNERIVKGDRVVCVLRRLSEPTKNGLIDYGIKVKLA